MSKTIKIFASIINIFIILSFSIFLYSSSKGSKVFDGQKAYEDVWYQVGLGPRLPGSEAHKNTANWIISKLQSLQWEVTTQETVISGIPIRNIIGRRGTGTPWIIIASHYDSRFLSDREADPENRKLPVVGANDGASTVAILLELARVLPSRSNTQIWLVFFDAEDNGDISGYEWYLGSQYFVDELNGKPDSVIILDMVGDKDLSIYMEWNSNPELNQEIWGVASEFGYL